MNNAIPGIPFSPWVPLTFTDKVVARSLANLCLLLFNSWYNTLINCTWLSLDNGSLQKNYIIKIIVTLKPNRCVVMDKNNRKKDPRFSRTAVVAGARKTSVFYILAFFYITPGSVGYVSREGGEQVSWEMVMSCL